MKFLRAISRVVIGVTFLLSGFVKIIDPVGIGLIIEEYMKVAGIDSWHFIAQTLGVALSGTEMLIGISLLVGIRMKIACRVSLFFISIFTILTLFLAIFNPVTDCGCFGEAIKLTNWQTFYKNIVFLFFAVLLYLQKDNFVPIAPARWEWGFAITYALLIVSLSLYSYRHLPMIDFMEFKVGTDIKGRLDFISESDTPVFETTLIYSKDGKRYEFSIENLPDSTYLFEDSRTKRVSRGSAHMDFAVSDLNGNYITDSLLSVKGALFIATVPFIDKLGRRAIERVNRLYDTLSVRGVDLIVLSGSGLNSKDSLSNFNNLSPKIYNTDFKTLLTMNRSNGGVVYLYDATVISKWSTFDMPFDNIDNILGEDSELVSAKARIREQLSAEITAFMLLIIISMMRLICRILYIHKPIAKDSDKDERSSIAPDSVIHDI
jgi:triosephosphate isomerase